MRWREPPVGMADAVAKSAEVVKHGDGGQDHGLGVCGVHHVDNLPPSYYDVNRENARPNNFCVEACSPRWLETCNLLISLVFMGYWGYIYRSMSANGFDIPLRAELPLSAEDAYWHACCNVEYVPRYGMIRVDPDCYAQRLFVAPDFGIRQAGDQWVSAGGSWNRPFVANISALSRFYGLG